MSATSDDTASGRPAARPSLVDSAERALRDWLAPGRYRAGDRLPPEQEVAAMLGVSRGTLRSALLRLEDSGEIVRRQGSGTFVGRLPIPAAFDERLERLEPYSSVARRRGVALAARDVTITRRPASRDAAAGLDLEPGRNAVMLSRTLLAEGAPVAVMIDVVHPEIALPGDDELRARLEQGEMVLDVLIGSGVPVTFARTRVAPALLSPRTRDAKRLGIRRTTAGLELEELIFAGPERPVTHSRDLFAPGGVEVMVMRSLEAPGPIPIAGRRRAATAAAPAAASAAAPAAPRSTRRPGR